MEPIIFNNEISDISLCYSEKPVLNIIRVSFLSEDKQWVDRLYDAGLVVKILALDKENNQLAFQQTSLTLGTFISPYQNQSILEVNKVFNISPEIIAQNSKDIKNWKIEITLTNLKFNSTESLSCEYMDSEYIKKRATDWQNRVHGLIESIKEWSIGNSNIKIKPSRKQMMHEGLMKTFEVPMIEIESADILKDGKTVMVLKPFGLWIMGANGRVDLLSAKGNYVIVDVAEKFQTPKWNLFLKNDKNQGVDFTKTSFDRLLGL